jgi:hypothetical protein
MLRTFKMFKKTDEQRDELKFEGVVFSNGRVAIHSMTEKRVMSWDSLQDMIVMIEDFEIVWDDGGDPPDRPLHLVISHD